MKKVTLCFVDPLGLGSSFGSYEEMESSDLQDLTSYTEDQIEDFIEGFDDYCTSIREVTESGEECDWRGNEEVEIMVPSDLDTSILDSKFETKGMRLRLEKCNF